MLTMLFAFQSSWKLMRRHQLLLQETVNTVSRDTRSGQLLNPMCHMSLRVYVVFCFADISS